MRKPSIFVKSKVKIVAHARNCKNIRGTARHFSTCNITTQLCQVRKGMNQKIDLKRTMKINRKATSTHIGSRVDSHELKEKLYDCILQQ